MTPRERRLALGAGIALLAVVVAVGVLLARGGDPAGEPVAAAETGADASTTEPAVTLSGVDPITGERVRLAEFSGKPVVLNFWASWCPPCQEETPILRDVYAELRDDGLELIAVSVQESTVDDVRRYADTYDLDYTIGFDATSAIFHTYRAFGLPTQLFIDREGVIRHVVLGPVTHDEARDLLESMLAEG